MVNGFHPSTPHSRSRSSKFRIDSGNRIYSITASWMTSRLVLKWHKNTGLGLSRKTISKMLSGKVVYSNAALTPIYGDGQGG